MPTGADAETLEEREGACVPEPRHREEALALVLPRLVVGIAPHRSRNATTQRHAGPAFGPQIPPVASCGARVGVERPEGCSAVPVQKLQRAPSALSVTERPGRDIPARHGLDALITNRLISLVSMQRLEVQKAGRRPIRA